ncbi:aldehyde dehydrogenase [Xylaria venustula]|nr:aldehyde dehydrogenase [Xylaria venustula]
MAEFKSNLNRPEAFRDQAYVNGEWVEVKSGKRFDIIDPGRNKVFATAPDMAAEDVDAAVQAAQEAFKVYRTYTPRARADLLAKFYDLIHEYEDTLAHILVYETGKPLAEAHGEIQYAATFTRWFAAETERIQGTTFPALRSLRLSCRGIFPLRDMILRKASAALAAGCTMIAKPSPETPLSALTLAFLAEKAGFAKGAFNVMTTTLSNTPALSEALCKHSTVKKVTFTGSTRVGKILAAHCVDSLKKLTLELGGNCPFLVFDDANLEQAIDALMPLKFRHAGQACITANRVYVQKGVYNQFAKLLVNKTREIRGINKETTMGPLTVPTGVDKVAEQVADATHQGGKILTGGKRVELDNAFFFEPTIISNATAQTKVFSDEIFGPLIALFPFDTEEEVVRAANNTSMGLASYCFTKNVDRTWRMLENLEAGMIGLNTGNASAAESPFGGIKESGFGKESGKDVAINEYMITKTGTITLEGHY